MSAWLSMLVSLAVVLGAIVAVAFVLKRLGVRAPQSTRLMKMVGQMPLGTRDHRLAIVEVDDRWLVLGITPQQITLIAETAKREAESAATPTGFASFLKLANRESARKSAQ